MEVNVFQVRGIEKTLDLKSESPHLDISLPAPPKWPGGDPFAEGWLASHSEWRLGIQYLVLVEYFQRYMEVV